jgi:hypothetical protein
MARAGQVALPFDGNYQPFIAGSSNISFFRPLTIVPSRIFWDEKPASNLLGMNG